MLCLTHSSLGRVRPSHVNIFSSTLPNPFLAWEGEAPAEPWRIKLGRSLALPLVSNAFDIAKMFRGVASPSRSLNRCALSKVGFKSVLPSFVDCNKREQFFCGGVIWLAEIVVELGVFGVLGTE